MQGHAHFQVYHSTCTCISSRIVVHGLEGYIVAMYFVKFLRGGGTFLWGGGGGGDPRFPLLAYNEFGFTSKFSLTASRDCFLLVADTTVDRTMIGIHANLGSGPSLQAIHTHKMPFMVLANE